MNRFLLESLKWPQLPLTVCHFKGQVVNQREERFVLHANGF